MGFNTVVFLLNDMMLDLERSPKAAIWGLTHPPMSDTERELSLWRQQVNFIARENGEPGFSHQALEVLPSFHASYVSYFRAGENCIAELKILRTGKTKEGKKTITLELPDWA